MERVLPSDKAAQKGGYLLDDKKSEDDNSLFVSIDDSSDEEDSVEQYDITEKIEAFRESQGKIDQNTVLSFITHAAGVYTLYSSPVQSRYYELKKAQLSCNLHFKDNEEIKKDIDDNIKKIEWFSGYNWKNSGIKNNAMNIVFDVIRQKTYSTIIINKYKYCLDYLRNYEEAENIYFYSVCESHALNPKSINNLSGNFKLPDPIKFFSRKTLENTYFNLSATPEENFVVEFLSHLRLHNRSEKRHLANKELCKDTGWQIFESENSIIKLRNESEYNPKGSRNEQVAFENNIWASYAEILLKQTDESIDLLLSNRINLKAEQDGQSLDTNVFPMWYLLFGCEVIKNPAALIHNNMVLDLVNAGRLSWDEAAVEKIPMSEAKIIKQAVKLNSFYTDFTPHKYSYDGKYGDVEISDVATLIEREGAIVKEWLQLKLGQGVSGYLIEQSVTDNNAVKAIWDLVLESFDDWGLPVMFEELEVQELGAEMQSFHMDISS